MTRCLLTLVIVGTAFGATIRASDHGTAAEALDAQRALRFSLDPLQPPPKPRTAEARIPVATVQPDKNRGAGERLAATSGPDNCGMPVLPASPDVDPKMTHAPRPDVQFSVRHVPPRACGR